MVCGDPAAPLCQSLGGPHVPTPFQLGDKIGIPDMRCRVTMAIQAPTHAEAFMLEDGFHGVDATMTFNTTDTACDMR